MQRRNSLLSLDVGVMAHAQFSVALGRFEISFSYQLFHDATSIGCSSSFWVSTDSATSTRAACQADQCPDTRAHSDNADTYATLAEQTKHDRSGNHHDAKTLATR